MKSSTILKSLLPILSLSNIQAEKNVRKKKPGDTSISKLSTASTPTYCTNDEECNDKNSCTIDYCNVLTNTCQYNETVTFTDKCRTYGIPKALALHITALDAYTTPSPHDISNAIFDTFSTGKKEEDVLTLKSQLSRCSHGKFSVAPFHNTAETGISIQHGVASVTINTYVTGEPVGAIVDIVLSEAQSLYGDLRSQVDFLLLCLPAGSVLGSSSYWQGYGEISSFLSVYNDINCLFPSVLMHEIGHNLGLSHANDELNYGDGSGTMGLSLASTSTPHRCFNAVKSWQLGWYHDSHLIIDRTSFVHGVFELVSIVDYNQRHESQMYTIIKIINNGDAFDYYINFNSNENEINKETLEGANEILVTKRPSGNDYSDSFLISTLTELQAFQIIHPGDEQVLEILAVEINTKQKPVPTASISLRASPLECNANEDFCNDFNECTVDTCVFNPTLGRSECIYTPLDCGSCGALTSIQLLTSDYPEHIFWTIRDISKDLVVFTSGYFSEENEASIAEKCLSFGTYQFTLINTKKDVNVISYSLLVGSTMVASNASLSSAIYTEQEFTICSNNEQCHDYNGCTVDSCNLSSNLCTHVQTEDCSDCQWFSISLQTDNYPEETSWELLTLDDQDTTMISSGDPFPISYDVRLGRSKAPTKLSQGRISNHFKKHTSEHQRRLMFSESIDYSICLPKNLTYSFIVRDSFGDGICCSVGHGYLSASVDSQAILSGGDFGEATQVSFSLWEYSIDLDCFDGNSCTIDICLTSSKTCIHSLLECSQCGKEVEFEITTDIAPLGTSWSILNSVTQESVMKGGFYTSSCATFIETKCLPYGSYLFNFYTTLDQYNNDSRNNKGKKTKVKKTKEKVKKRGLKNTYNAETYISSSCSKQSDYSLTVGQKSIIKEKGFQFESAFNITFLIEMPFR